MPDDAHMLHSKAKVEGGGKFEATLMSDVFEGENIPAKRRLVYAALDDQIKSGEVHAVFIRAYTPAEWSQAGGEL